MICKLLIRRTPVRENDMAVGLRTEDRLLTVAEAANYLSVSTSTLYGWVWQRRIPFVKVGRALRFQMLDLQKFVESNRREARK